MNNYKIMLFVLLISHLMQPILAAVCRKNEECSKDQYCDIIGLGRCVECSTICNVNTNAMQKQCERVCPGYIQAHANRAGTTTAPWVIPSVATAMANGVDTTMAPEVMAGVIIGSLITVTLVITVVVLVCCLVIKKGKRPCKRNHRDRDKRKNSQDPEENIEMLNVSDTAKRKDSQDPEENTKMLNESESTSKLSPAETPPSTGQSRTRYNEREDSHDRLSINPMRPSSLQLDQEVQPSTGRDPDDMIRKQSVDPGPDQVIIIHEKNQTATPWTLEDSERYRKREDNDAVTSPTTTDSGFPQSDPNSRTTTPDHTHRSSPREESPEGSSDPGIKVTNNSNSPQHPSQLVSTAILKTASPSANQTDYPYVNGLTKPKPNSFHITATGAFDIHIHALPLNNPLNNDAQEKNALNNINPSTQDKCELVTSKNGGQGISSPTQETLKKAQLANGHTC